MPYDTPSDALEALVLSIDPQSLGRALFINAYPHKALQNLNIDMQQYFKPYTNLLNAAGHTVRQDIPIEPNVYDSVLILIPQNKIEARYCLARGIKVLKQGGQIFCAGSNKAGGKTLKKMLQEFGFDTIQEQTKNKCRIVSAAKEHIDENVLSQSISEGSLQEVLAGKYHAQPGIFGWKNIDKGSEILLQHLPAALEGQGADFGCGYGYLSIFLLQHYKHIKSLACIDADARAVTACKKNLEKSSACTCIWDDLTQPQQTPKGLDFIIMNPPFHAGKKTNIDIGKAFITNAFKALRKGGVLYMVANAHLPYERVLNDIFQDVSKRYESAGFKVFHAEK